MAMVSSVDVGASVWFQNHGHRPRNKGRGLADGGDVALVPTVLTTLYHGAVPVVVFYMLLYSFVRWWVLWGRASPWMRRVPIVPLWRAHMCARHR